MGEQLVLQLLKPEVIFFASSDIFSAVGQLQGLLSACGFPMSDINLEFKVSSVGLIFVSVTFGNSGPVCTIESHIVG